MGWHLVNMTQYPEAALAREAGLAYAGVGLVTDYDSGTRDGAVAAVTAADVFAVMANNVDRVRELLAATIGSLVPGAATQEI
jgi:5'-methylthioadenosine phosphorylase